MSKQVYQVKNAQGQVIGARQSGRAYTHAVVWDDEILSFSSSEQGAQRNLRAECKRFKLNPADAYIVEVECLGVQKPVKLTFEGCDLSIKTFRAYKYAVISVDTGDFKYLVKKDEAFHYTLEQA